MTYDPAAHHRRSIRLRAFDDRTPGRYVVTICTEHRVHRLGRIIDGAMALSPAGAAVRRTWEEIPLFYPGVDIDAFVVMPNHIHGIVYSMPTEPGDIQPRGERRLSLFDVVERYKSLTTKRYGDGVRAFGWPPYPGKLWQRGYYERVARNEAELDKFRRYIEANPARWFEVSYRGGVTRQVTPPVPLARSLRHCHRIRGGARRGPGPRDTRPLL